MGSRLRAPRIRKRSLHVYAVEGLEGPADEICAVSSFERHEERVQE
jgi:hypothetical protein